MYFPSWNLPQKLKLSDQGATCFHIFTVTFRSSFEEFNKFSIKKKKVFQHFLQGKLITLTTEEFVAMDVEPSSDEPIKDQKNQN